YWHRTIDGSFATSRSTFFKSPPMQAPNSSHTSAPVPGDHFSGSGVLSSSGWITRGILKHVSESAAADRSAGLQACQRPPGSPKGLRYARFENALRTRFANGHVAAAVQ